MKKSEYRLAIHASSKKVIGEREVIIASLLDRLNIGIERNIAPQDLMCLIRCIHPDCTTLKLLDEEQWGIVVTLGSRALILTKRGEGGEFYLNGKKAIESVAIAPERDELRMHRLDIRINSKDEPTTVFLRLYKKP